jgi:hypothetical protein
MILRLSRIFAWGPVRRPVLLFPEDNANAAIPGMAEQDFRVERAFLAPLAVRARAEQGEVS